MSPVEGVKHVSKTELQFLELEVFFKLKQNSEPNILGSHVKIVYLILTDLSKNCGQLALNEYSGGIHKRSHFLKIHNISTIKVLAYFYYNRKFT